MISKCNSEAYSIAGEVAVSGWVAGVSKGHHEVLGAPGEPETVLSIRKGSL